MDPEDQMSRRERFAAGVQRDEEAIQDTLNSPGGQLFFAVVAGLVVLFTVLHILGIA